MVETTWDPSRPSVVHVVGIGGAGMSAIATVLVAMGHTVTGSDLRDGGAAGRLRAAGVEVCIGHDGSQVPDPCDVVLVSSAVDPSNPEVTEARRRGIDVLSRSAALGPITAASQVLSVAGTHGKTTTSAFLTLILRAAGLDPSFVIGAEIAGVGAARWSGPGLFVLEGDESDGSFLAAARHGVIVTNIEADHLDHYGSFERLAGAFEEFVAHVDGPVVLCAEDRGALLLRDTAPSSVTYGRHPDSTYRIVLGDSTRSSARWELRTPSGAILELEVAAPGVHHVLDASAAAVLALELGVEVGAVVDGLAAYRGLARRFERRGSAAGVDFVDDYAHLPAEVAATLSACVDGGWERVVAVFQPHRYSRTALVGAEFADAFDDADIVIVTDIYPAGEVPLPGVSGKSIVDVVLDAHPRKRLAYLPDLDDLSTYLWGVLRPGDVCITLGAGDLTELPDRIIAAAPERR